MCPRGSVFFALGLWLPCALVRANPQMIVWLEDKVAFIECRTRRGWLGESGLGTPPNGYPAVVDNNGLGAAVAVHVGEQRSPRTVVRTMGPVLIGAKPIP